jgi:predicted nucleotidyltransferase component of viral defense system
MATLIQMLQKQLASKDALLANETKRILLIEGLQAYVLDYLYNHSIYADLNFYGGSCLRFIYGLNRLSEDIDLDNQQGIDLANLADDLLVYVQRVLDYPQVEIKRQKSSQGILRITLKFSLLQDLGLSTSQREALHLKLEISHHSQVAVIRKTPIIPFGRSFVAAHYSLETMMAAKMLACLERSFQRGKTATKIKGRDYYDLLWFMQQRIQPLEAKLNQDGKEPYTTQSAMQALVGRVEQIKTQDLAIDLLPLFEQHTFIQRWIEAFHDNFNDWVTYYLRK